jgi:hypothetical protein
LKRARKDRQASLYVASCSRTLSFTRSYWKLLRERRQTLDGRKEGVHEDDENCIEKLRRRI